MSRTVTITGGTGFVGRRIVNRLQARGWNVRVMTRTPERIRDVAACQYPRDHQFRQEHFEGVDAVIHAAAYVPSRMNDTSLAEECFRVNALGTLSLIGAASTSARTIITFSSGNIYAPAGLPRTEADPIYPHARAVHYLLSKAAADAYTVRLSEMYGFRGVVLRPSSIYGPGMPPGFLRTCTANLANGRPVEIAEGGCWASDFVYVDDVADAAVAAVERDVEGAFNVGSGVATRILDAATEVARVAAAASSLIRVDGASGIAVGFSALDCTRARELLGVTPRDLPAGLRAWCAEEAWS